MLPNFKAEKTPPLVHPNKKSSILNRSSSLRYEQRGDFASKSAGKFSFNQNIFFFMLALLGSTRISSIFNCLNFNIAVTCAVKCLALGRKNRSVWLVASCMQDKPCCLRA